MASLQTRDSFAEQIIYISAPLLSRCCNIVAQRANVAPIILTPSGIADSNAVSRGMVCRDTRNYFLTLDLDHGILIYRSDELELLIHRTSTIDYDCADNYFTFRYDFFGKKSF